MEESKNEKLKELKEKYDAMTQDERKEAIKKAGIKLTKDQLGQISGGTDSLLGDKCPNNSGNFNISNCLNKCPNDQWGNCILFKTMWID